MRLRLLASFLLLAGCASDVAPFRAPIVDGAPATEAQVLGTVAMVRFRGGGWVPHCTGTLIETNVVLTAAHCVVDTDWNNLAVREPLNIRELGIVAGSLDVATFTDDQLYAIGSARAFPSFPYVDVRESPSSVGRADDLALLVLLDDVTQVTPVPILPFERVDDAITTGAMVALTGYGRTSVAGPAGMLYWAETPVIERTDHEVLAGGPGVPDSCFGDSGGPGYVSLDGTNYVWGVTSRGNVAGAALCGDGGIYTLASAYEDWIAENTGPAMPVSCAASPGPGRASPWFLALVALLSLRRR